MKKTIKLTFIACLILLVCVLMFTACNSGSSDTLPTETTPDSGEQTTPDDVETNEPEDEISFKTLQVNDTSVYGVVSNDTTIFSFINEVSVSGKATYVVSLDIYGMQTVITKTVPLEIGDNTFYILEQIDDNITLYTVTVRRKPMYTVSFATAGGTAIASQSVEEGSCAVPPNSPNRIGCTFIDWSHDFSAPITDNIALEARWKINDEMSDFVFSSSETTCTINGVHDNTKAAYIIPDYVTDIDKGAFEACSSLESITLPFVGATKDGTSNTHFGYIFGASSSSSNNNSVPTSLRTVVLTGGTSIGDYAFRDCISLTSITIPDSLTSIGHTAFYKCDRISTVYYGGTADAWSNISIGVSNTELTRATHYYSETEPTESGKYWHYVDGVPTVWEEAQYSVGLSYELNSDGTGYVVTGIWTCTDTEIVIPAMYEGLPVTSIGDYAFYGCSSLTSVYYHGTAGDWNEISIESYNSDLTSATRYYYSETQPATAGNYWHYVDGVPTVWEEAQYSVGLSYKLNSDGTGYVVTGIWTCTDTEIVIPAMYEGLPVTSIGDWAFEGRLSLTSVTIPDSVTNIGSWAFISCHNLTSVTIGGNVTSIGHQAFSYCKSLANITIPDSVTSIGVWAFYGCDALTSVAFENLNGWWIAEYSDETSGTNISSSSLANTSTAAEYLTSTYKYYYWNRS